MSEQSELLDQLKIDRSVQPSRGIAPLAAGGIALLAALVGAALTAWLLPTGGDEAPDGVADTRPARSEPSRTAAAESAAVPEPAAAAQQTDNRILNASGYVTARR
ncbi:MAG: hypothetical protein AAF417_19465, partial [Pseudomonadota bacterium]